jgi:ATP-dependent RNA helicase DDX35
VCFRLYPLSAFAVLPMSTPPEVTRADLTTPILQLKSLGIDDLVKFDWATPPPAESVLRALEGLVAAGMVGEDGRMTLVGEKVAECPVEVNIARMVRVPGRRAMVLKAEKIGSCLQARIINAERKC